MTMNDTKTIPWQAGQRAVIDRREIVTIDRVTPLGRAKVGSRTFDKDGREYKPSSKYHHNHLEHLTAEIQAEMDFVAHAHRVIRDCAVLVKNADDWLGRVAGQRVPDAADIDRAERLVAAIRGVLEDGDRQNHTGLASPSTA